MDYRLTYVKTLHEVLPFYCHLFWNYIEALTTDRKKLDENGSDLRLMSLYLHKHSFSSTVKLFGL